MRAYALHFQHSQPGKGLYGSRGAACMHLRPVETDDADHVRRHRCRLHATCSGACRSVAAALQEPQDHLSTGSNIARLSPLIDAVYKRVNAAH